MNPAQWLARSAARTPDRPALYRGTELVADYRTFYHRSAAIAGALTAECGLVAGDRVAIYMNNRTEYLEALYGIWCAGGVPVPVNAKLHPKEAAWIIGDSQARVVFSAGALGDGLCDRLPDTDLPVLLADADFERLYSATPVGAPVQTGAGDMIWLFYTSGTTGKPKGVMISSAALETMIYTYFVDVDDVPPDNAILYAAPMSHAAGIYNFMHVMRGAPHVVPVSGAFDAGEILELAPKIGNLSMFAAPTMVKRLVDHAKAAGLTGDGLRTIIYAGGPMYLADIIEAVDVMGPRFVQVYGQGECPMAITALSRALIADRAHPRWRERQASLGVAQSSVVVRVVDDDGVELPVGAIGEITVKGLPVMTGYWKNPEATATTLRDGWLWTGDMGAVDKDGFVSLHDRSKDMIISGGSNIYPREVEEALLLHASVSEVAVVGRADTTWGEKVVAFVVASGDVPSEADLDAHCLGEIARFKRPKDYRFVDELPKSNYGKVLKTVLREMLEQ